MQYGVADDDGGSGGAEEPPLPPDADGDMAVKPLLHRRPPAEFALAAAQREVDLLAPSTAATTAAGGGDSGGASSGASGDGASAVLVDAAPVAVRALGALLAHLRAFNLAKCVATATLRRVSDRWVRRLLPSLCSPRCLRRAWHVCCIQFSQCSSARVPSVACVTRVLRV
jgi:hypothetical protein